MKLLSHLMKLLHLMTLPSQQFYLYDTLFNVHDTLIKHALIPLRTNTNIKTGSTAKDSYYLILIFAKRKAHKEMNGHYSLLIARLIKKKGQ